MMKSAEKHSWKNMFENFKMQKINKNNEEKLIFLYRVK